MQRIIPTNYLKREV